MPKLNRELTRTWPEKHNRTVQRPTPECNTMGEDTSAEGSMPNAINGIHLMRPGHIKVICRVLAKYGDGIPHARLVEHDSEGRR